ncbi:MAG TPA: hypothetical protein VKV95_14955 [Terriglobia bacterium]|nr:hypothetical protein [Terriglobia bacterium]
MPKPTVEITTSGRGGSILYKDGDKAIKFDWEFALPPALALIFGHTSQHWDKNFPWASARQEEIYKYVAEEVVRQKAPESAYEIDLDSGTLTILMAGFAQRAKPLNRFMASLTTKPTGSADQYDIAAIGELTKSERKQAVELITTRGGVTWREVEALAAIGTPEARAAIDAASEDHLSIDTRLAAAEVMNRGGRRADFDIFLARQIRQLSNPANGLSRALEIASRHPSETVKQALLWASYNATECAPHCAGLLLTLAGLGQEPFDDHFKLMLQKLDLHNSYFDRKAAFEELCKILKMDLDSDTANY